MRELVTGQAMKAVDSYTIQEIGIPSLVLMERAALAVAEEVKKRAGKEKHVLCACGCGNNGADGAAAARMLHLAGYSVKIVYGGDLERGSREFKQQIAIARKLGVRTGSFESWKKEMEEDRGCVLIDGIFGVGLSRLVDGVYREFLEKLQALEPVFTAAVDLPSGVGSDDGQVMGAALKADLTVTFGWEKLGTVLYPGRDYAGQVIVADIGFPREVLDRVKAPFRAFTFGREDLERKPVRPARSHKGTFGNVLAAAGSRGMGGAAFLSALAAYRTGAGLVRILTVEENRDFLQARLPEAVLQTYDPALLMENQEQYREMIKKNCEWADVTVLGPGIGQEPYAKALVEMVLPAACGPVVADADALNIIAAHPALTGYFSENVIITPHLGEMARLSKKTVEEIRKAPVEAAREYAARYGVTCVLKDAATVAALRDGRVYVNTSGNSAMAKAGSGDVLTGVVAGLLAQGMDEAEGTALGVYLHGAAGDLYREKAGLYGMLAGELADQAGLLLK